MALVRRGAAELLEEKDLTGESLIQRVEELFQNPAKLRSLSENAKKTAILDANERIYQVIREVLAEG